VPGGDDAVEWPAGRRNADHFECRIAVSEQVGAAHCVTVHRRVRVRRYVDLRYDVLDEDAAQRVAHENPFGTADGTDFCKDALEGGVELFEMLPRLQEGEEIKKRLAYSGSSAASLHAKLFLFDRERVFIGSMNLDPRSIVINTEIGLLIDSPALAQDLEAQFDAIYRELFYSVVLEPKYPDKRAGKQSMVWIEYRDGDEIRYTRDPETSFWQRFKAGFIGLLPVESQL